MTTIIRPAASADLFKVLAINNAAIPNVNELSEVTLQELIEQAAYFRVAEHDGSVAGFLLAHRPSADYDSLNFQWFKERFEEFLYIDRVVVAAQFRGHGIGNIIYADVHSFAEQVAPMLTCEVNLLPRNDVSLMFHAAQGFTELGQQWTDNQTKKVSLMAHRLPDYQFVKQTYGG